MRRERAAWVALSAVRGLGPARFRRLLEEFGSGLGALEASAGELTERAGLPEEAAAEAAGIGARLEAVEEEIGQLGEQGVRAFIWLDSGYPARLRASSSAPPVLWWAGEMEPDSAPGVAVVGSREVSEEGLAWARAAACGLAEAGVVVISGLAAGVDAAAHEGAIEAGGLTLGVCGCGVLTALSRGRGGLAGRVVESGALCSELRPTAPLVTQTLYARNRIIAGLAEAVVVVEARAEGGAVHTAKCALEEGTPVLAVRWPESRGGGNAQLLAEGARPVSDPEEIAALILGGASPESRGMQPQ